MNKYILAAGLLLLCSAGQAQQKIKFSSQTYIGVTAGELNTDLVLQTINGVKWKKWFGGLGAGIDWYYFRSVPVFASVNRDLFRKGRNTLLLTGDVGVNIPWKESNTYFDGINYRNEFQSGLYWATGIGYKFGVGHADNALSMNFGYSVKRSKQEFSDIYPCFNPPCLPVVEQYDYWLKRLTIRLGWIF